MFPRVLWAILASYWMKEGFPPIYSWKIRNKGSWDLWLTSEVGDSLLGLSFYSVDLHWLWAVVWELSWIVGHPGDVHQELENGLVWEELHICCQKCYMKEEKKKQDFFFFLIWYIWYVTYMYISIILCKSHSHKFFWDWPLSTLGPSQIVVVYAPNILTSIFVQVSCAF